MKMNDEARRRLDKNNAKRSAERPVNIDLAHWLAAVDDMKERNPDWSSFCQLAAKQIKGSLGMRRVTIKFFGSGFQPDALVLRWVPKPVETFLAQHLVHRVWERYINKRIDTSFIFARCQLQPVMEFMALWDVLGRGCEPKYYSFVKQASNNQVGKVIVP